MIIQTSGLTKKYGAFTAVNCLDLQIEAGEMVGFLGPNGAGKTTTLRMLLGSLRPTSGEIQLFGQSVHIAPFFIRRRIGVMMEMQSFYEEMTAWEYLMFFGRLYEVKSAESRANSLLDRMNLSRFRDVLISAFSTGMQRKLSLARALLHNPELLILDEPVSGLDPFGIVQIREILKEENAAGKTILISSHILSEVERTANRVGILSNGRLIFEGSMERIHQATGVQQQVEVTLAITPPGLWKTLRAQPFVHNIAGADNCFQITIDAGEDARARLGITLFELGAAVQELKPRETTLEDAFITLTESYARDLAEIAANGASEKSL